MLIRILLTICAYFVLISSAFPAYIPLEITNIKPAGTGTPVISSTNRIFRAYPGIEYNIRAAVIGGLYPYTYSLSGQPSGMTINSATGEISWTNPTTTSGTITLTVTDAEAQTDTAAWVVTVGTSGFVFVDSTAGTNGTGTLASPFNSWANMLTGSSTDDFVYFRAGTYNIGTGGWMSDIAEPRIFVAYPGETVTIDMNDHELADNRTIYYDGLIFDNMDYDADDYSGVVVCGNYSTVRRNEFKNFSVTNPTGNHNFGMLKMMCTAEAYYYNMVIQDNEFHDFSGGNAIGSIYHQSNFLIENNYVYNALGIGASASHNGISPKVSTKDFSIRGNKFVMSNGNFIGDDNSAIEANAEIAFNLFVNGNATRRHVLMNWNITQETTWFYRNTLIGDLILRGCTSSWDMTIVNNVISNPNTNYSDWTLNSFIGNSNGTGCYQTVTDNLTNTMASTLIDSSNDYKLQPAQSAYVGTRGWQLADGTTPMEGTYEPPPAGGSAGRMGSGGASLGSGGGLFR